MDDIEDIGGQPDSDQLSFDPADPPPTPPVEVACPMLYRLAVRLLRDHRPRRRVPPWRPPEPCVTCGDPWPCRGHRVAERGLLGSLRPPVEDDGAQPYRHPG